MSLTAILFPGQGSQSADMRDTVQRVRPDLLERATASMGLDPFGRVQESTEFAQPAIFCASLAGWTELGKPLGDVMAGHSLGELTALAAAEALSEGDALELVVLRGRLMGRAGAGGMVALLGPAAAERAPELAAEHGLVVANDNCPTQVVLSGPTEALPAAVAAAQDIGLRTMDLPVSGAFHSPMMAPAVPEFAAALDRVEVRNARVPVLSAVTARPFDDVRRRLAEAITSPVRWRETVLEAHRMGAERFLEVGPGRVLAGLVKRTLSGVELVHG
ncbi:MAG TPA: ACP S-malonyltransferase [Solirubrobacteraceae bacterium]|jgi:malonyl CoA-acyl carrier protein transacylase